jgi:hypothetical protein
MIASGVVPQPEFQQDERPELGIITFQTLREFLQSIPETPLIHVSAFYKLDLIGMLKERRRQGHQRLEVRRAIGGFRLPVENQRRQQSGKRTTHQAPRLVRPADHVGWYGEHEFNQGPVCERMCVGDVLERLGHLQGSALERLARAPKSPPPPWRNVAPTVVTKPFSFVQSQASPEALG